MGRNTHLAESLATRSINESIEDVCKAAEVSRSAFYRWMKLPEFRDLVSERIQSHVFADRQRAYKALMREVLAGDVPAIRTFFQLSGDLQRGNGMTINVVGMGYPQPRETYSVKLAAGGYGLGMTEDPDADDLLIEIPVQ